MAKADLQVAALKQSLRFANTSAAHRQIIAWLRTLGVVHVVLEASGGYENQLLAAHYQHLRAKGKPATAALAACAGKLIIHLNGLLKNPQLSPC